MSQVYHSQGQIGIFGVRILGLGADGEHPGGVDYPGGYLLCTPGSRGSIVDQLLTDDDGDEFELMPVLDPSELSVSRTSIDQFTATSSYSGIDVSLRNDYSVAPELLTTADRFAARLTEDLDASLAPTLECSRTDLSDTVIWMGGETLLLGGHLGGGTYQIVRGLYGSRPQAHQAGTYIYTTPSEFDGRAVELWVAIPTYRTAGTGEIAYTCERRALGAITGGLRQDKATIPIEVSATLSAYQNAERGRGDRRIGDQRVPMIRYQTFQEEAPALSVNDPIPTPSGSKIFNDGVRYIEIDDRAYRVTSSTDGGGEYYVEPGQYRPIFDSIDEGEVQSATEEAARPESLASSNEIHEVLAWTTGDGGLVSAAFDDYFDAHPLAWYAALHFSSPNFYSPAAYDVLGPGWSLQAEHLYGDGIIDRVTELIEDTPTRQIDQIVLGAGGEPFDLRQWARRNLLRAWGFYEAPREDGSMWLYQVTSMTLDDYQAAQQNSVQATPGDLWQTGGQEGSISELSVKISDHEYAQRSTTLTITTGSPGTTQKDIQSGTGGKATVHAETVATSSIAAYRRRVISQGVLQSLKIPRVGITLEDSRETGGSYDVGAPIALEGVGTTPDWLVDRSGQRASPTSDVQWAGYLAGRLYDPVTQQWDVEILLLGDALTRRRGPTAVVDQAVGAGEDRIRVKETAFADPDGDLSAFYVGDIIHFRDYAGRAASTGIWTITDIDEQNNVIIVDSPISSSKPEGYEVALPAPGAAQGAAQQFSGIARVYVYLADDQGTLDDDDEPADEYGA